MTVAADLRRSPDVQLLERCAAATSRIKTQVARIIVGQDAVVDSMLVTLLARGHALLVGVPGLAKTLLVSTVARTLSLSFGRVQFTPDLLPADITGTDVLNEVDAGGGAVRREVDARPDARRANAALSTGSFWKWRHSACPRARSSISSSP